MLVTTIDAQWEWMGDVGLARYELALLPPCSTIRVLSYITVISKFSKIQHFKGYKGVMSPAFQLPYRVPLLKRN